MKDDGQSRNVTATQMPSEININNQNFFESRSLKNDFAKLVRQRIYIPLMCS